MNELKEMLKAQIQTNDLLRNTIKQMSAKQLQAKTEEMFGFKDEERKTHQSFICESRNKFQEQKAEWTELSARIKASKPHQMEQLSTFNELAHSAWRKWDRHELEQEVDNNKLLPEESRTFLTKLVNQVDQFLTNAAALGA